MNTMQGAFSLACLNRSRTLAAPIPTNISTNSEPEMEKKGTWASPATALASKVLPVPGGPTSNTPLGSLAPMEAYLSGWWRKSTTSINASFASSWPATSAKVFPVWDSIYTLALALPKLMALPAPMPPMSFLDNNCPNSTKNSTGSTQENSRVIKGDAWVGMDWAKTTPLSVSRSVRSSSGHSPV